MTSKEALEKLKAILGKGLYPNALPQVAKILSQLEEDSFEAGFKQAQETVNDWYKPKPLSY